MASRIGIAICAVSCLFAASAAGGQETPTAAKDSGQTITPAFEGWYKNSDGTYSLSFGYFNRNSAEVVDVPVGPNNNVSPGVANQGQPTRFYARRHWGVFAVKVPANFGDKKVTWTLNFRGKTYAISGHLKPQWEIDALQGEAGSNNTPPVVRFDSAGAPGAGPAGIYGKAMKAAVGQPMELTVWATDDGVADRGIASEGRGNATPTLMWFVHQGAGDVKFEPANPQPQGAAGRATTRVTFPQPGEYVLRLRLNDSSGIDGAGHAQCCWSNGFVKVTVTQ
jgi:hypothetical protein